MVVHARYRWTIPSDPAVSEYLIKIGQMHFGKKAWGEKRDTVQQWSGIMATTPDGHSLVGEAPGPKGLWMCADFNGHGMGLAVQPAQGLVQLLLGEERVDEWFPDCYRPSRLFPST